MKIIQNIIDRFFLPDQKRVKTVSRNIRKLIKVKYASDYGVVDFDVEAKVFTGLFPFGKPDVYYFYKPTPEMVADFCHRRYHMNKYLDKDLEWLGISSKHIVECFIMDNGTDFIRRCMGENFILRIPIDYSYHVRIGFLIKEKCVNK